jgi:leucyl-tRNA synthetase
LWADLGQKQSVHISSWPTWDDELLVEEKMIIVVQVNGKVRANIEVDAGATEEQVIKLAQDDKKVASYLADHSVKKSIYVPNKLVNFVI